MSFLSSHRLHWGEHDALTGHFFTHLEMHVHDLPRLDDEADPGPDADAPAPDESSRRRPGDPGRSLLPDVPGP